MSGDKSRQLLTSHPHDPDLLFTLVYLVTFSSGSRVTLYCYIVIVMTHTRSFGTIVALDIYMLASMFSTMDIES